MDHVYPSTSRGFSNGVVTTVSNSCGMSGMGVHDAHINGLSLQEMIDSDMKEEFDDVMRDHGLGFGSIDSLDLLGDLDAFDSSFGKFDTSGHTISNGWLPPAPSTSSHTATSATDTFVSSYMEDLNCASTVMVNPNNVMPVMTAQQRHQQQLDVNASQFSPSSAPVASIINGGSLPTVAYVQQQSEPVTSYGNVQQIHTQSFVVTRGPTKTLKVLPPVSSPLQRVPSSPSAMTMTMDMSSVVAAAGGAKANLNSNTIRKKMKTVSGSSVVSEKENAGGYPKPAYSYSCLIALALKNSESGSMSVSEIYKFMCENFPYFKTAPTGWKNSVRHNLSLNKCFEKIEKPVTNGNQRKGCLWTMNPAKVNKMDEEVQKWSRKDKIGIMKSMVMPETLESLERGDLAKDYNANTSSAAGSAVSMRHGSVESGDEDDPRTPASVSSQGSQGYDSGASDFVDIENFAAIIPDSSLPELNLQATGGIYEDLGEERLRFSATPTNGGGVVSVERVGDAYYQTVHANYAITPAVNGTQVKKCNTLVVQKHDGVQKVFSV